MLAIRNPFAPLDLMPRKSGQVVFELERLCFWKVVFAQAENLSDAEGRGKN